MPKPHRTNNRNPRPVQNNKRVSSNSEETELKNLIEYCDNRITESGIKIGYYANLKQMYQKMLEEK